MASTLPLLVSLCALAIGGCARGVNYGDPAGPRFAGAPSVAPAHCAVSPETVRVVTWNAAYAEHVDGIFRLLSSDAELRGAHIVILQEMDEAATRRVADGLGLHWVYYPATLHPVSGRNFGNALLACWHIEQAEKLALPHLSKTRGTQRTAVLGTVPIGTRRVRIVALHFASPLEVGLRGQREQAETVIAAARGWPHVIAAGDFNHPDLGRIFVNDGFAWPTRGLGPTYGVVSLDHIVARGFVSVARGRIAAAPDVSDHDAVWTDLAFSSSPG